MQFGNPTALWLLFVVVLAAVALWRAGRWRERSAARLGDPAVVARLYPPAVRLWRRRRALLLVAAATLLTLAAARPQYGRIEQMMKSSGVNVLIAMDTSRSMTATDVLPNRLERARTMLSSVLRQLSGNRVGIIAFAGTAFLNCPMTLDHAMALLVLRALDVNAVGVPGTDLGAAIETATGAFERGAPEGGRALVLLTDGEDNEGKGIEQAKKAAEKGIKIYAIGIGSRRGAPVLDEQGKFKEEPSGGGKVNSRLDMDTLHAIADATGGRAFEAGDRPEAVAVQVADLIRKQEHAELESQRQILYQDRFQWLLLPAIVLLSWALLLRPAPPTRAAATPAPATSR